MEYVYYIVALVIVVFSLLYYHLTSTYGYWKKKSIPYLKGALPGLGNVYPMLFMQRHMADMYRDFYNRMPGHSMIGFYNMREPCLMVRDPELVKTVLLKNFHNFAKNNFELDTERDPLLAGNPFFSTGDQWKAAKQYVISAFTSGKLKYMYASVTETCVKFDEYLHKLVKRYNGEVELELKDLFSNYTAEAIASAGFGVDDGSFKSEKDGPFREIGRTLFEPTFFKGFTQIMMLYFPFIGNIIKLRIIPSEIYPFFGKVVKDVLKQREEEGSQRADFLQLMFELKKSSKVNQSLKQEINDDIIISQATLFFDEGYETSSITLSFLAYQLAVNPEIQDRVREEVNNVLNKHGSLTWEAIQEMKYMDQALKESMRLYPAFGTMMKTCTEEIELVGSDGITCRVTPGMPVIIPHSALQRDPEYWPDPEKFDPERFSEENVQSRHKFVHLPFGEGPRICPGQRMAMVLMKACMATMIRSFTWEVSPRTKEPIQLNPNYYMSAIIGGLWVKVKRLQPKCE